MVSIPCWLWRRALADRTVAALLLLTLTLMMLPPGHDGAAEPALAGVALVAAAALWPRRPSLAVALAAGSIVMLAAAALLQPHLWLAGLLPVSPGLSPRLGLAWPQQAKLVAAALLAACGIAAAMLSSRLATDGTGRTLAALALWLHLGPALAAGLLDLLGMLASRGSPVLAAMLNAAELAAELVLAGAAAAGSIALHGILAVHARGRRRFPSRLTGAGCAT